ncbi:hypothetical protein C8Q74DRAFT_1369963 [Fomes fomentarius]|nr:hypothetical protein C8Q74DRAFT_1369963 [Fomes fomentarius]
MESTISWKSAASTVPNRPQFDVKSLFQNKSSDQTTKTLFHLHDIEDVLSIFNELPPRFHSRVVDSLLSTAVESSDTDAQIAAYYFQCARLKGVCSAAAFKDGFYLTTAALRDIAVNCIDAPRRFAIMQKAAGLCAISRVPTVQGIFDSQVVTGPVTCDVQLETVVDAIRSTVKVGSCGDKDCRGVEWDRETRGGSDWEPDDCEDDDWWSTAPLPSEDGWDSF